MDKQDQNNKHYPMHYLDQGEKNKWTVESRNVLCRSGALTTLAIKLAPRQVINHKA